MKIIHAANISGIPWGKIRPKLIEEGLITESPVDGKGDKRSKWVFKLTKKGRLVITACDDLGRYLSLE